MGPAKTVISNALLVSLHLKTALIAHKDTSLINLLENVFSMHLDNVLLDRI